jgi:hypothetical protein
VRIRLRTRTAASPRALGALLGCFGFWTHAIAASGAAEFGAQRWPTAPTLTMSSQPELCNKILAAATGLFTSAATDLDISVALAADFPPREMRPMGDGEQDASSSSPRRLDLDLEGNGSKQVIVYRDIEINWQGNWHYSYVFASPAAFDAAKGSILSAWTQAPQDGQYPSPGKRELDAQQYYPSALTVSGEEIQTGNVWADHALIRRCSS